jgi:hypothetical protein|tara:strand:+ start:427 stop:1089 length:663 start_codon:yes stop_codon:yes gene_type:complete
MRNIVRNTHKYLSFFISLQLFLWTISGIYFAFNKIELVRGEQYRLTESFPVNFNEVNFSRSDVYQIKAIKRLDEIIFVVNASKGTEYLNALGTPVSKLSKSEVFEIVSSSSTLEPIDLEEISESSKGSEFRGRDLPLYKVTSLNDKDKKINLYLNVFSGEITAVRSLQWRIWDLMWGFHIMDWQTRDKINNIFLKIFSILALVSSISGILLFFRVDFNSK